MADDEVLSLDEILKVESAKLHADPFWYPLIPQTPVRPRCPDHPGLDLIRTEGCYSHECPECHKAVCVSCGSTKAMWWWSRLCSRCQQRQFEGDARRQALRREAELDHMQRATDLAVALEQDGAELRKNLRFLHRPEAEGPDQACRACLVPWPCESALLANDDEDTADQIRERINATT